MNKPNEVDAAPLHGIVMTQLDNRDRSTIPLWCPLVGEIGVWVKSRSEWKVSASKIVANHPIYINACRSGFTHNFCESVWVRCGTMCANVSDAKQLDALLRAFLSS